MHNQAAQADRDRDVRLKRSIYRIELTDWPLVSLTAEGDIAPADLDRHLIEYGALFQRNLPFAVVYDATKVGKIDAYTRRRYAEFHQENNENFRRLCRGIGFVINSSLVRGALTAVLWMVDFPFPYKIFATRDEAAAWARRQLWR
jgi:hypothetical protein